MEPQTGLLISLHVSWFYIVQLFFIQLFLLVIITPLLYYNSCSEFISFTFTISTPLMIIKCLYIHQSFNNYILIKDNENKIYRTLKWHYI